MSEEFRFLGKSANYWLTLETEAQRANTVHLIDEIAKLRGQVSYYESRIAEMGLFMQHQKGAK